MKQVKLFSYLLISFSLVGVLLIFHAIYKSSNSKHKGPSTTVGLTYLVGNPYQNNTMYFTHFEYSDYFSGHFYFPSSPILGDEAFIYKAQQK